MRPEQKAVTNLLLLEVGPVLLGLDHEALGGLWVRHCEVCVLCSVFWVWVGKSVCSGRKL